MSIPVDDQLLLKQIDASDAPDIFRAIDSQRDYLGRWLPFVEMTRELGDTEAYIESVGGGAADRRDWVFVIRHRGAFAGIAGLKETDHVNRRTEIGYWLSEPFQKQGLATRAVRALVSFAFESLGMHRIQIRCAVNNLPSRRIPERLGFAPEGIERDGERLTGGAYPDLQVYSLLRHDAAAGPLRREAAAGTPPPEDPAAGR